MNKKWILGAALLLLFAFTFSFTITIQAAQAYKGPEKIICCVKYCAGYTVKPMYYGHWVKTNGFYQCIYPEDEDQRLKCLYERFSCVIL